MNEKWEIAIERSKNNWFANKLAIDLSNIEILSPIIDGDGHKVSDSATGDMEQFFIIENGEGGYKVGAHWTNGLRHVDTFEVAYSILLSYIKSFRIDDKKKLRFWCLVIPKSAVEYAVLERHDEVLTRYIVDYFPNSDTVGQRWDVLVERA